jgi:hypothetical protein
MEPTKITWGAQGLLKGRELSSTAIVASRSLDLLIRVREPFAGSDQEASSARCVPRAPLTVLHDATCDALTAELQSRASWAGPGLCRARVRPRCSLNPSW